MNPIGIFRRNVLELNGVHKVYRDDTGGVEALRDVSLAVGSGEFVAVMGPSGCGKSTLLNLLGGVDRATGGTVAIAGHDTARLDDDGLTLLRRRHIGFVFQLFNLLPTLTLRENAALPLALLGQPAAESRRQATELLAELGLAGKEDRYPHQVSGGEMQRVAIARALIHSPALILADEPTGNLDTTTGAAILDLLGRLSRERGQTIVMATHDAEAAARCGRVIQMRDGAIVSYVR